MPKKLTLLIIFLSFAFFAKAETVVLKSGKVITGKITERTDSYIKVDIGGIAIKYYLEAVETIDGKHVAQIAAEKKEHLVSSGQDQRTMSESWLKAYAQAEKHVENREFQQAIAKFNEVLEEDPQAFEAYTGIGFVYIHQGEYEKAIASFNKAIEINPEYAPAYDNIGVVYSFTRRYSEAIPYFEKAIHLDPEFVDSYNNLGSTYLHLGQYQHAVIYYQKALQLDPTDPDSAYNLGVAYLDLAKPEEARHYLEKAKNLYQALNDYYGLQRAEEELKKTLQ